MVLKSTGNFPKIATATATALSPPRRMKNNMFKITKHEVRRRGGYILLGISVAYLVTPLQDFLDSFGINPWILGIVGVFLAFYFFEF